MRPHTLLPVLIAASLLSGLGTNPAHATSVSAEASAGASHLGLSILGDIDLRKDTTLLVLCYGATRPAPDLQVTHQLCAGVDQVLSEHWVLSAQLNASPATVESVQLTPRMLFRSVRSSAGATVSAAYDSGQGSSIEHAVDASIGVTSYRLLRELLWPGDLTRVPARLVVVRPSVGATLMPGQRWELGLRATYHWYSTDPVRVGRFDEQQLDALERRIVSEALQAGLTEEGVRRLLERPDGFNDRLLSADAVSGLAAAPIWFELRPVLAYRFTPRVKGQLSYTYDRYVSGQGWASILSAKATFRVLEQVRAWAAFGVQVDVLGEPAAPSNRRVSGLGTLGAEYTF